MRVLGNLGARRGRFRHLPLASGWTKFRDMPAPAGQTFQEMWAEKKRRAA
jgi:L-lactate dehydrogenase complex protein LldF